MNQSFPTVNVIQDSSIWEKITAISAIATAVFTLGLLLLAFFQLRSLLRNNSLKTILSLEAKL